MYTTDRRYQIPHQTNDLKVSIEHLTNTFEMIEDDFDNVFINEIVQDDGLTQLPLRKNKTVQEIHINQIPIDSPDYNIDYENGVINFNEDIILEIDDVVSIYFNIVTTGTFNDFLDMFPKVPNWSNYQFEFKGIVFYNSDDIISLEEFLEYYKGLYPLEDNIEVRTNITVPENTEAYSFGDVVPLEGSNIILEDGATLTSYKE